MSSRRALWVIQSVSILVIPKPIPETLTSHPIALVFASFRLTQSSGDFQRCASPALGQVGVLLA